MPRCLSLSHQLHPRREKEGRPTELGELVRQILHERDDGLDPSIAPSQVQHGPSPEVPRLEEPDRGLVPVDEVPRAGVVGLFGHRTGTLIAQVGQGRRGQLARDDLE